MHYYQFNIGDYASHTRHLSMMEDLIYRRLLDWYYLNEKPIPKDCLQASRLIQAKDHFSDVEQVLNEFFTLTEEGWINKRADDEISHFKAKSEQASKAGKASAQARFNRRLTDVQPNNNHKPITINHNKTSMSDYSDEFEQFWSAYPKKTGKGAAWSSWKKQKPEIHSILSTLSWQTKSTQWTKDNGQFIPMPTTYLNQRRWEDVPDGDIKTQGKFNLGQWIKDKQ